MKTKDGDGVGGGGGAIVAAREWEAEMPQRVLIVDDIRVNRKLLRVFLQKRDYEIFEAETAEQAMEVATSNEIDLVLLDIVLPDRDGYWVCEQLKNDDRTKDVPIIFLSAHSEVDSKIKGLELGAIDYISKPFDPAEMMVRVQNQLRLRSLTRSLQQVNQALQEKQNQLESDLVAAGQIQQSLLPAKAPKIDGANVWWHFEPCINVGGDIFNVVRLDEEHWMLYVADVSGHGVSSAMVTVPLAQALSLNHGGILKTETGEPPHYRISSATEVLCQLDELFPIDRFDKCFTINYLIYNTRTRRLTYTSAAHPSPLLVRANGSTATLDAGGSYIGIGCSLTFEQSEITLDPGDRLFLYTDGLYEVFNEDDEQFGLERLHGLLADSCGASPEQCWKKIHDSLMEFSASDKPDDDITLVCIEITGESDATLARQD